MNQRESAREYFKKCNLSYSDINMNDLYILIKILNKKMFETDNYLIMIKEPHLKGNSRNIIFKNNKLIFAALRVKGGYFDDREAITFNQDEFIGFCVVLIKAVNLLLQVLNLGFQCGLLPVIVG